MAVLIDGGHLRALARKAGHTMSPDFIEAVGKSCVVPTVEEILRILYYDCPPYKGEVQLPVSGTKKRFAGNDAWLHELSKRDLFAIRCGVLKFRGFKPRSIPVSNSTLKDADFAADFEQKGVDMRIGLDIASLSANNSVERIALMTNDTDCVPAMKHARKSGVQVVLLQIPGYTPAPELLAHTDYTRKIDWPCSP